MSPTNRISETLFASPDLTDYYAKRYADVGRGARYCECKRPVPDRCYHGDASCRKCELTIHPARMP